MTEDEARDYIQTAFSVPRETMDALDKLASRVRVEGARQNLISASTMDNLWVRHIVDSAQLLTHAPKQGSWIDLGSGAGFPGLVIALLGSHEVVLAESRSKRIAFLIETVEALGLTSKARVFGGRVEAISGKSFDVISARAFAPLDRLLATAEHLSRPDTRWVLPKGRGAQVELDAISGSWQGNFGIVQSITDPEAAIITADKVCRSHGGHKFGGSMR